MVDPDTVVSTEGRVAPATRPSRVPATTWAPPAFVLLWSTGFVVAHYGTEDAGPLTFLAVRLAIAAVVLALVAGARSAPMPTRGESGWLALTGFLMHAVYLGGVFIAIDNGLPSGVSALIAGLHPVVTSLAAGRMLGERLVRLQWVGVTLGFAGVVAVVVDRLLANSSGISTGPLLASALSTLGMSAGTLVQRKRCSSTPLLWGTVVQYAAAAAVLMVGAGVFEQFEIRFTTQTIFAMVWAVVVLSFAAVLIMLWLLQHQAASAVSSLFFLTPALSTVEGAILFDERLGVLALAGLAVALTGVALVTRGGRPAP
jgi:drug/metabolite transporter (DMT)-like permease